MARNPKVRRHEVTDPNPMTLPVKFQKPPTLAEQIARYMGAHQRFQDEGEETANEADDFDVEDEDSPHSPHELVYDELLNREMPRYEKEMLERGRARFDAQLQEKIRQDRLAADAAARSSAPAESYNAKRKNSKKIESSDDDEE